MNDPATSEQTSAKDEFLAFIAHELRSPLNAIRGWAHVLRRSGELNAAQLKALDAIDRNTGVQARMVDDLLDSQRILNGELQLDLSRSPLRDLIDECLDQVQPTAASKRIRLEVTHDPAIGIVSVDVTRMRQALVGVVANAVKCTPEQGTVRLRSVRRDKGFAIEVQDNGIGLEAAQVSHVFDAFRQGLGLGLSLAQQLVKLHGGRITVESDGPGHGAKFTIELPDRLANAEDGASAPVAPRGSPLIGKRVVIVEDDADWREILGLILRDARVEFRSFDRAATAFDYLAKAAPEDRPDALISDISMPDEDGYEFIRRVRQMEWGEHRPHLVALALTSFARIDDRVRAIKAGFDFHLAKPVDSESVLAALAQALGLTPKGPAGLIASN